MPDRMWPKEMGVSRQCVSRWIARYQAEGEPGLQERSCRPRKSPKRTSDAVEAPGTGRA